ncbi:MAG: C40 family peptidase [Panacibacter sp.]
MLKTVSSILIVLVTAACSSNNNSPGLIKPHNEAVIYADTVKTIVNVQPVHDTMLLPWQQVNIPGINNGTTTQQLVSYAKTLIGVPYKYASTDPSIGFDCSGFITYVFNHFGIQVPRSSVDFTNVGKDVTPQNAREGDLILFTGTVDSIHIVGHMGIVTENSDTLRFIHSTSGRANGVTISALNVYYQKRFVKVIRIFKD